MDEDLTLKHALNQLNKTELKSMLKSYDSEGKANPRILKPELVEKLAHRVTETEKERIIDTVFNKPSSRYLAHFGKLNKDLLFNSDEIAGKFEKYNKNQVFDSVDFEKSSIGRIDLVVNNESETIILYSEITKTPQYDVSNMTSSIVKYQKRVRVVIDKNRNRVIVFTGDKDIFNDVLSALTVSLDIASIPLNANNTGIAEIVKGSFTFETVKFIDFLYNGIGKIAKISEVSQVELETLKSKTQIQKVRVQGDKLLSDPNVCNYLLIHARSLVGIKVQLQIEINAVTYNVSTEIGIRGNRLRLGIKKDKYSIAELKMFFELIENLYFEKLAKPGLINEDNTLKYLAEIRTTALRDDR